MTIQKSDWRLDSGMFKYGMALLKQELYTTSFRNYECYELPEFEYSIEGAQAAKEFLEKPIYDSNKYPEFSPDLSEEEIDILKNPDLFTKEELVKMINTLLIEKYTKEIIEYERPNRHGNDNAIVSNTKL